MGQTRRDKAEPSLELPSFPGLGRRKKSKKPAPDSRTPDPGEDTTEAPAADPAAPVGAVEAQESLDRTPFEDPSQYDEPSQEPGDIGRPLDEPTEVLPEEDGPRRRAETRRPGKSRVPKVREPRTTPLVPGRVAAALTGLVVGAAGAAGTYGAMAGCKAVRGVSSCGGAPGFLILVAILVLMVLLGTGILKLFGVGDAGSTSFLAVGIVAVVAMLVLLDVIFSAAMFVVVPLLSAIAFALAHWVTTRFADDKGRRDWT